MIDLAILEGRLGYQFANRELLEQALTHRSHGAVHNERLEFLGDAVLNCAIAQLLFQKFGRLNEGDLSRLRANLVKQQSLAEIAERLELSQFLRLGEGERKSGGFRRPSILADTLEAAMGAVFVDRGFEAAREVIARLFEPVLKSVDPKTLGKDSKTLLQEFLQGKRLPLPQYTVVETRGAAHNQEFEVECVLAKLDISVRGSGRSRRAAEQSAAKLALEAAQAAHAARRVRRKAAAEPGGAASVAPAQGAAAVGEQSAPTEAPNEVAPAATMEGAAAADSASHGGVTTEERSATREERAAVKAAKAATAPTKPTPSEGKAATTAARAAAAEATVAAGEDLPAAAHDGSVASAEEAEVAAAGGAGAALPR